MSLRDDNADGAQVVDSKPAGPPERKMLDRVIEKLSKKDPHRIFQRPVTDEEVRWVQCEVHVVTVQYTSAYDPT